MAPALAVLRVGSCDVPKLAGYGNGCRALREHAHVMVSKEASVATGVPHSKEVQMQVMYNVPR